MAGVVGLAWVGTVCFPNTSYRSSINEWFQSDAQTAQVSISSTFTYKFFVRTLFRQLFPCTCNKKKAAKKRLSYEKRVHKRLMKLTTGIDVINILHTNFSYERCFGSFFHVHVTRKKLPKNDFHTKKCVRKRLMKLIAGINIINILCKPFMCADPKSAKRYWLNFCTFQICAHKSCV
jgi:hypothetical protein